VEPTETEKLRGRVLRIIDAYGMGVSLDRRALYVKTGPATPPPEPVPVPDEGYLRDGGVPCRALGEEDGRVRGARLNATRIAEG
jgi:hypothetical protein